MATRPLYGSAALTAASTYTSYDYVFYGTSASELIYGSAYNDLIYGRGGNDDIYGGSGGDTIYGAGGRDYINGGSGHDDLFGGSGADTLIGGAGLDNLYGGSGNDWIAGGAHSDYLYGGTGADIFVFTNSDVRYQGTWSDYIDDFYHSDGDLIDVSRIDAIEGGRDNAFRFIGDADFTGRAGELRYTNEAGYTYVEIDTDGDRHYDYYIELNGSFDLSASDFIL